MGQVILAFQHLWCFKEKFVVQELLEQIKRCERASDLKRPESPIVS